jgi:hypothetical protein
MARSLSVGLLAMTCGLFAIGCDSAKTAASKAQDAAKSAEGAAKDAKEAAMKAAEAAKTAVVKPIEEALPKIEEKIKGLSGDAMTKAKEKYEAFKKLIAEFKAAGPEKWESLKDGLTKAFDELKKMVGLDTK